MNSLIPPLTTPSAPPASDSGGLTGTVEIPAEGGELGNLKPGQNITISITPGLEKYVSSVKININNQLFEIPIDLKLSQKLALEPQQPYEASAKVVNANAQSLQVKITALNGQPPEKLLAQRPPQSAAGQETAAVIRPENLPVKPEVSLHNLSLSSVLDQLDAQKTLPPAVRTALKSILMNDEIPVGFKNVVNSLPGEQLPPETAKVIQQLRGLLQNAFPAGDKNPSPAQIADLAVRFREAASGLSGLALPGETFVRPEVNVTGFKTALGEVYSSSPLKLDAGLPVELIIKPADLRPQSSNSLADLLRLLTAPAKDAAALQTPRPQAHLLQNVLQPLAENHPELAAAVAAKIPGQNNNLLGNLVNYVKAAVAQDIKQWIGPEVIEKLVLSGAEGKEALSSLQNAFTLTSRETPLWRIIEIPFFSGEHMEKIRLAIKKYNEEEDETPAEQKRKYGTRFVVDTNFTRLGRFQFDGYSLARDKRFDLIIRTERDVGSDLCANIMRIFKTTLYDVGYAGTVHINVKENFIKIGEDISNDDLSTQGLYI